MTTNLRAVSTWNSTRKTHNGTLGAIVYDRATGERMALSDYHVYVGETGQRGDAVSQSTDGTAEDVIGTVTDWDEDLDCAVARLDRHGAPGADIEVPVPEIDGLAEPRIGMRVTKSGIKTGTTSGVIGGVWVNQFLVVPEDSHSSAGLAPDGELTAGGDSGAVWVLAEDPRVAVGLHFGGEDDRAPTPEEGWATTLVGVAQALGIRFRRLPVDPQGSGAHLRAGEALNIGTELASPNGLFHLVYQPDGDLTLRRSDGNVRLWGSDTSGPRAGFCIMQQDGDLVLYDPDRPCWRSGTAGNPGSTLEVRDDGAVAVVRPGGTEIWRAQAPL